MGSFNSRRGSSLRVQGRQPPDMALRFAEGFIPAGAGATSVGSSSATRSRVHPCGCRGDARTSGSLPPSQGSSLRVQGRRGRTRGAAACTGFIPAGAGATGRPSRTPASGGVHPCGCRGDTPICSASRLASGSSLRVQGRQGIAALEQVAAGFIPAGAGATSLAHLWSASPGVHPCGCRGDAQALDDGRRAEGSSLRVQGRLESDRA